MNRKPVFSFDSTTSTGIDQVPVNGVILIENDGFGPRQIVLTDKTGITGATTIADLLALPAQYKTNSIMWSSNEGNTTLYTSGSGITGGNGDAASSTTANLRLHSWQGIGFATTASGQTIPQGENAVYINTRNGDLTARGNVTAYSDERLKDNIQTIENALDKVAQLRGVSFTKGGEAEIGVIAQEVREVIPEVVKEDSGEEKYLHVAYGNIVGVLIEAIKELKAEVDSLKG